MALQGRVDQKNFPFFLGGSTMARDAETILTNAGRVTPLVFGTVMAQVASSKKWVPLTDVAASATGENVARGIYVGDDITAAALVAGDVTNCPIVVGGVGVTVDAQQLVLENSLTIDSVVSDDPAGADNAAVCARRIEDDLRRIGIFVESTIDIMALEN